MTFDCYLCGAVVDDCFEGWISDTEVVDVCFDCVGVEEE